ncbi:MAG: PHP domain-containing protein [Melioribacteraceae bacterium]|nr:PHP domain-containing protein [Melioribacteraceae bacterium]
MFEFVGALHMHSTYSDGSGTVEEIAKYADEVGLDFIILTDHNTLRALNEGKEKWYGNTLLLVGCEINDRNNQNHYLALNIKETYSTRLAAVEYVKKVKEAGGIGFLAHPHEKRDSMEEHPPYPWTDWDTKDFTGIEIWNHMSEWMEGLTEQNKFNHFVHPLRSIVAPNPETVKVWDELNLERKVVGIGGVDAHAHKINLMGFFEVEVFPYKVLFKSVRTHVFCETNIEKGESSDHIENAKTLIYSALGHGRCFVSNYYHGDAKGFRFFGEAGNKIYHMGDTIKLTGKVKLRVILPNISGRIILVKNGEMVDEVDNFDAEFIITRPGIYRVEVYQAENAWIFSNHIRIVE